MLIQKLEAERNQAMHQAQQQAQNRMTLAERFRKGTKQDVTQFSELKEVIHGKAGVAYTWNVVEYPQGCFPFSCCPS